MIVRLRLSRTRDLTTQTLLFIGLLFVVCIGIAANWSIIMTADQVHEAGVDRLVNGLPLLPPIPLGIIHK